MAEGDGAAGQLETLRGLVNAATSRLLGDTIAVGDEDWPAPSRLPGWSRGHVASHIARQADGMVRLTEWARSGQRQEGKERENQELPGCYEEERPRRADPVGKSTADDISDHRARAIDDEDRCYSIAAVAHLLFEKRTEKCEQDIGRTHHRSRDHDGYEDYRRS